MEPFSPEIIDKLFAYPALLGVGFIMWIHYKLMSQMLSIIKELKNKEKD